jgi:putative ABC transport system permease protein
LKALGYSNSKIMNKYLLYSLSATLIGITLGVIIGNNILTGVLYESYRILYSLPNLEVNLQLNYLIIAVCFAIFCTVIFAIAFSFKELQSKPAELIRPKSPKEGKKILLERMSLMWNKFNFNNKMMFRNIFRYKKRLFMAIVGIAGCTALIYSGFSLKTSVDSIAGKQFGDIKTYDLIINLNAEMTKTEVQDIVDYISKNEQIDECTYVKQKAIDVEANKKEKEIFYAAAEADELSKYILLKDRQTDEEIELSDDGVIITEKLSKILNIKKDDKITIKDSGKKYEANVLGISENYLFNFIYMTPGMYEKIEQETIKYNQIFVNTVEELSDADVTELSDYLKLNDKIGGVALTKDTNETYQESLESLITVVALFIGSSAMLSFIVLYNLNNINIEERRREFATMKVLGFEDKEVATQIHKENIIISIMGGAVGLFLGTFLLSEILTSAELETILLVKELNVQNFVYAFVLTIIFTLITNATIKRSVRKIDMIESLKSIE